METLKNFKQTKQVIFNGTYLKLFIFDALFYNLMYTLILFSVCTYLAAKFIFSIIAL